jgi:quercetin dioxygenase-like cupin family protein
MEKFSLTAMARAQMEAAHCSTSGRSATTVYGGHEHSLRQTVIAICSGRELGEHSSPGEATVHVISGHVVLVSEKASWEGAPGDLLVVPDAAHSLQATEDSVVLLTVAKRG